jgi:hypothetical protein
VASTVTITNPAADGIGVHGLVPVTVNVAGDDQPVDCTLFVAPTGGSYAKAGVTAKAPTTLPGPPYSYDFVLPWDTTALPEDSTYSLRANVHALVGGVSTSLPGVYRRGIVAHQGRIWPLNVDGETPREVTNDAPPTNWPGAVFGAPGAVMIVAATDPDVPPGAPSTNVLKMTAMDDPIRGPGSQRAQVAQRYPYRPEWYGPTSFYDPAWADGRDGLDGMERWLYTAFALPAEAATNPPPADFYLVDWHSKWSVPIQLLVSKVEPGYADLLIRAGRMEALPVRCAVCGTANPPASSGSPCVYCGDVIGTGDQPIKPIWAGNTTEAKASPYYYPRAADDTYTTNLNYYTTYSVDAHRIGTVDVPKVSYGLEYQRRFVRVMPLNEGRWNHIEAHYVLSPDRNVGLFELSVNGQFMVGGHMPTIFDLVGSPVPDLNPDGHKPIYLQHEAYRSGSPATVPPQRTYYAPRCFAEQRQAA